MIKIKLNRDEFDAEIEEKNKSITKDELVEGLPLIIDAILTNVCTSNTEKKDTAKMFVKRMQELGLLDGCDL